MLANRSIAWQQQRWDEISSQKRSSATLNVCCPTPGADDQQPPAVVLKNTVRDAEESEYAGQSVY
ncbi:hypothetical protein [Mesorhizobium sp.]|nr:hypothetical protein [Mesorhizobium sp.]TIL51435.1 MAG: hypothetical protein E5Y83_17935 [Mesorhizobium sp.]